MALSLETMQPITIDDKKCAPKVDPEQKLRLSQIKLTGDENKQRSYEIIAGCFPEDRDYVLSKLPGLSEMDISVLVTYLIQGETGVKAVSESVIREIREAK